MLTLTSRFKIKRRDGFLLAVFYVAVGILELAALAVSNFLPVAGGLAVLSLIAAYGFLMAKRWSVWLVITLFFPQVVFGAVTLYNSIGLYTLFPQATVLLLNVALAVFIVLSFISFVYVAAKRKTFD